MTLSTQRGTPRRTVLNALVAAIRYSATIITGDIVTDMGTGTGTKRAEPCDTVNDAAHPSTSACPGSSPSGTSVSTGALKSTNKEQVQVQGQGQGQGFGPEDSEMCSRRLRTLTRLAAMVTLVIKASGATGIVDPSSTTHTPQVTQATSRNIKSHRAPSHMHHKIFCVTVFNITNSSLFLILNQLKYFLFTKNSKYP